MKKETTHNEVDAYIAAYPADVQKKLQQVRNTIRKAAPDAEEVISYSMPGYKYHGMLVYFAAWKTHIGFYAVPSGHAAFKEELSAYKGAKGSVQFPLDKPMPVALITKIVKFRMRENEEQAMMKELAKPSKRK
ncbi:MAG: hypothetical protein K0Q79_1553 [Flavipsychrobacter sp.]|jgi:uncharacterized protein YdhG (YjbR/CyaY superfamily)|nr:hypothetical protein [Flavipsychrobacter sp.]